VKELLNRLPSYPHKAVRAAPIVSFHGTSVVVALATGNHLTIPVPADFAGRGEPAPGDYLVAYEDGYLSHSPKTAFDGGYTPEGTLSVPTRGLCFGTALAHAKEGRRIAREGWNGKGMFLQLQVPDEHSKMRRPYIYMSPVDGDLVPWVASQSDLLADDWHLVG
jgi:hypothetical protein